MIILNSEINLQKSFWRIKFNIDTAGVNFNAIIILKIKKMYNNIEKAYTLTIYRAFILIDRFSRIKEQKINLETQEDEN